MPLPSAALDTRLSSAAIKSSINIPIIINQLLAALRTPKASFTLHNLNIRHNKTRALRGTLVNIHASHYICIDWIAINSDAGMQPTCTRAHVIPLLNNPHIIIAQRLSREGMGQRREALKKLISINLCLLSVCVLQFERVCVCVCAFTSHTCTVGPCVRVRWWWSCSSTAEDQKASTFARIKHGLHVDFLSLTQCLATRYSVNIICYASDGGTVSE